MKDHNLPIIDTCDDCGACCLTQKSPPGYAMLLADPTLQDDPGPFAEDVVRLRSLPTAAADELRAYLDQVLRGVRQPDDVCIWFDRQTKRCRYHDHRPRICHELEIGSDDCLGWREEYGIGQS